MSKENIPDEAGVVIFHFTLTDKKGNVLDSTTAENPEYALLGGGELVPGLEEALLDKKPGDKFSLSLSEEDAYGEYRKDLEIELNIDDFPEKPEIEEEYLLDADNMSLPYRVEKIEGKRVFLNGNHLFAGNEVTFEVDLLEIRKASEEELVHGHAHGPDSEH